MEFLIGGIAATGAGILTNPLEVVKHHMEISKKSQFTNKYQNFFHAGFKVAKREGLTSLQKGLSPALGAHILSYGTKLGSYQFGVNRGWTKDSNGQTAVLNSVCLSGTGGLLGQFLSNPFYLLKAEHYASEDEDKKKSKYSDTVKRIYREHGIRGFFRGSTTSLPRAVIGTSQLTSFAIAKEKLNEFELFRRSPLSATILAGTVAGVVLSLAMAPFETVLTKMYKQAMNPNKKNPYIGYLDCIQKIYRKNGIKPFYRTLGPVYLKVGPHTGLCLLFWEQLKNAYDKHETRGGKEHLGSIMDLYRTLSFGITSDFDKQVDQHSGNVDILYL